MANYPPSSLSYGFDPDLPYPDLVPRAPVVFFDNPRSISLELDGALRHLLSYDAYKSIQQTAVAINPRRDTVEFAFQRYHDKAMMTLEFPHRLFVTKWETRHDPIIAQVFRAHPVELAKLILFLA